MRLVLTILFCAISGLAEPLSITVLDGSGMPVKDVLVIVQDLDDKEREMSRCLTDTQGQACPIELAPGLYRVIGTTPYGLWNTSVAEFLMARVAKKLTVSMTVMGTHGYGDIVPIGIKKAPLLVLRWNGEPAAKALVLARDRDATLYLERWYRLSESGQTTVELVGDPTVVVVIDEGRLVSQEISGKGPITIHLAKGANP
jgi:hypothetical protein